MKLPRRSGQPARERRPKAAEVIGLPETTIPESGFDITRDVSPEMLERYERWVETGFGGVKTDADALFYARLLPLLIQRRPNPAFDLGFSELIDRSKSSWVNGLRSDAREIEEASDLDLVPDEATDYVYNAGEVLINYPELRSQIGFSPNVRQKLLEKYSVILESPTEDIEMAFGYQLEAGLALVLLAPELKGRIVFPKKLYDQINEHSLEQKMQWYGFVMTVKNLAALKLLTPSSQPDFMKPELWRKIRKEFRSLSPNVVGFVETLYFLIILDSERAWITDEGKVKFIPRKRFQLPGRLPLPERPQI